MGLHQRRHGGCGAWYEGAGDCGGYGEAAGGHWAGCGCAGCAAGSSSPVSGGSTTVSSTAGTAAVGGSSRNSGPLSLPATRVCCCSDARAGPWTGTGAGAGCPYGPGEASRGSSWPEPSWTGRMN